RHLGRERSEYNVTIQGISFRYIASTQRNQPRRQYFMVMSLSNFHPIIARWFAERIGEPTAAQRRGWDAIRSGADTLIAAPTGSGKTLAAFLTAFDGVARE